MESVTSTQIDLGALEYLSYILYEQKYGGAEEEGIYIQKPVAVFPFPFWYPSVFSIFYINLALCYFQYLLVTNYFKYTEKYWGYEKHPCSHYPDLARVDIEFFDNCIVINQLDSPMLVISTASSLWW